MICKIPRTLINCHLHWEAPKRWKVTHSRRGWLHQAGCAGTHLAAGLEFPNTSVHVARVDGCSLYACILCSNASFARSVCFTAVYDPLYCQVPQLTWTWPSNASFARTVGLDNVWSATWESIRGAVLLWLWPHREASFLLFKLFVPKKRPKSIKLFFQSWFVVLNEESYSKVAMTLGAFLVEKVTTATDKHCSEMYLTCA